MQCMCFVSALQPSSLLLVLPLPGSGAGIVGHTETSHMRLSHTVGHAPKRAASQSV